MSYNADQIRRYRLKPMKREDCLVCGKWREITVLHHILPVAVARQYEHVDTGLVACAKSAVWLCPNHHAMVHVAFGNGIGFRILDSDLLTEEERKRLRSLVAKQLDLERGAERHGANERRQDRGRRSLRA